MNYWSAARYHLHLSEDEFWALTPRQFTALFNRRKDEIAHTELLTGMLCAAVVNFSMAAPKTPVKAADFMPSQWDSKAASKRKPRLNRKRIAASIGGFFQGVMQAQQQNPKSEG